MLAGDLVDQRLSGGAQVCHVLVLPDAQHRPDLRMTRRDAEHGFAHLDVGEGHRAGIVGEGSVAQAQEVHDHAGLEPHLAKWNAGQIVQ